MPASFDPQKLQNAWKLIDRWVQEKKCPAVAAAVGRGEGPTANYTAGRLSPDSEDPLAADAIFLIASPTKPLTATAVLMLAEEGRLLLEEPVCRYVPEFGKQGKERIEILHCLTHTSGLPDMLPRNLQLRQAHAPLSDYLSDICELKPDFQAGTRVQYQSTGYLMLAEIVARVSGMPLAEFLQQRLFKPLGMFDAALGMPPDWETSEADRPPRKSRIASNQLAPGVVAGDCDWNSDYWRRLGAPWGGLLSTAGDWAILCRHLLAIHRGQPGLLSAAALTAMTDNQLATMPDVPETNRRCTRWGYGWQLNWPNHPRTFGNFLSPQAYGHWGATGTMIWIDPPRDAYCVLLTTGAMEDDRRRQALFSNAVCGAMGG